MENSNIFESLQGVTTPELLDSLDRLQRILPQEWRYRLKRTLESMPRSGDSMQKILELVREQWRGVQSQEWVQIAVVGPGQTGKFSLVQAILRKQAEPLAPIFSIVETPGLEEFLGYHSDDYSAPPDLRTADMIILVLDGRYGLSSSTLQMFEGLKLLKKPIMVVLNKMDLVRKPREAVKQAQTSLRVNVFGASIFNPASIDRLLNAIVLTNSKALYPLTRTFPEFRRTICKGIVTQSAIASGIVGAVSIPVSDMLPLTAIQTAMLLKIARAFGYQLNRERATELLPMLALGGLIREGSHRLRKGLPRHKKLIAISTAGLWTLLLGKIAIGYFEYFSRAIQESPAASLTGLVAESA